MRGITEAQLLELGARARADAAASRPLANTVVLMAIGGSCAYWAYQSIGHAVLFAFLIYVFDAASYRIIGQVLKSRYVAEANELEQEG